VSPPGISRGKRRPAPWRAGWPSCGAGGLADPGGRDAGRAAARRPRLVSPCPDAVWPVCGIRDELGVGAVVAGRAEQAVDEWVPGHPVERRKVATGTRGRAFATPASTSTPASGAPCTGPAPPSATRIAEIRGNLTARIAEADRQGWPGETEGLKISLAGAQDKLTQIDRRTRTPAPVGPGMPALSRTPATNWAPHTSPDLMIIF